MRNKKPNSNLKYNNFKSRYIQIIKELSTCMVFLHWNEKIRFVTDQKYIGLVFILKNCRLYYPITRKLYFTTKNVTPEIYVPSRSSPIDWSVRITVIPTGSFDLGITRSYYFGWLIYKKAKPLCHFSWLWSIDGILFIFFHFLVAHANNHVRKNDTSCMQQNKNENQEIYF